MDQSQTIQLAISLQLYFVNTLHIAVSSLDMWSIIEQLHFEIWSRVMRGKLTKKGIDIVNDDRHYKPTEISTQKDEMTMMESHDEERKIKKGD